MTAETRKGVTRIRVRRPLASGGLRQADSQRKQLAIDGVASQERVAERWRELVPRDAADRLDRDPEHAVRVLPPPGRRQDPYGNQPPLSAVHVVRFDVLRRLLHLCQRFQRGLDVRLQKGSARLRRVTCSRPYTSTATSPCRAPAAWHAAVPRSRTGCWPCAAFGRPHGGIHDSVLVQHIAAPPSLMLPRANAAVTVRSASAKGMRVMRRASAAPAGRRGYVPPSPRRASAPGRWCCC